MPLLFHRLLPKDLRAVLRYYEEESGLPLADRFFAELEALISKIAQHPRRFPVAAHDLRRANMARFPYHLLFREASSAIHVLVLRHHKRHPSFGLSRTLTAADKE